MGLCTVFGSKRLDLQCLSLHRRRNEYQQVVEEPELQKYRDTRGYPAIEILFKLIIIVKVPVACNTADTPNSPGLLPF